ncbi:MAG: nuclear transport factor 2 family protein [Porticoccaceae bacterium]
MKVPSTQNNKSLVERYLRALGSLDGDKARLFMHEDYSCRIISAAVKPDTYDAAGFCRFIEGFKAILATPIEFTVVEMTAEEDRVSTVANGFSTTIDGTFYNNNYHFLNHIRDGKVIRHLEFMDSYLGADTLGPIMARLRREK